MNQDAIELLLTRRSVSTKWLGEPGPGDEALEIILTAAARVPDHKKLEPWRFIVFEGEARRQFGELLAGIAALEESRGREAKSLEEDAGRLLRAPTVICVVSSPVQDAPVPLWEQTLSAGAVCQNILLAATALGFGAQWVTEWLSYSEAAGILLGLASHERVAGFIYVGTPSERPIDRPRPDLERKVTLWRAPQVAVGD
ncbi:MAG: nitroreductase [Rhizobiales bacterium]|nr:nitroreductase [Hyphomicrobiales bacterium]